MCLWKREVHNARVALETRNDLLYERAIHRLENLPDHAIRPPMTIRRELDLHIETEICSFEAPRPNCTYHNSAEARRREQGLWERISTLMKACPASVVDDATVS